MTVIGVTGHQDLPEEARDRAKADIRALLKRQAAPVIGMASLAIGADQLFAQLVLDAGGELHAIIPARNYQTTFHGETLDTYLQLRAAATWITELDFEQAGEPAYFAAGNYIVEHCEVLVAVWDGRPARGHGGTGDAVKHARDLGRHVIVTWPEGLQRASS